MPPDRNLDPAADVFTPNAARRPIARIGLLIVAQIAAPACGGTEEGNATASADTTLADVDGTLSDGVAVTKGAARIVYTARRGVSTPFFVPISAAGVGPARQLGPRRGAGYGHGEGEVSYPQLTPDGGHVVVVFYPLHTPSSSSGSDAFLFALPIDGSGASKPIFVAHAPQLHALERAYADGKVAYVDGKSLRVARLDGSDAAAPVLVATVDANLELSAPRWLPGAADLAYSARAVTGGGATLFVARADGSQLAKPHPVMTGAGPAGHVCAMLPAGRLVVRGGDNRLYNAASSGSAAAMVLTPPGLIADCLGASSDGTRVAVVLRTTWQAERQLVSVTTDGSEAANPRKLAAAPVLKLSAILSRDGGAVAWAGLDANGQWTVWRAPIEGPAAGADGRVSTASAQQLRVTDFYAADGPLVGARGEDTALVYQLDGAPAQAPQVLGKVEKVVNHSGPWPVVSADGARVSWHAHTPAGWQTWSVPVGGGTAEALPSPWYADLLAPPGLITREYIDESAAFTSDNTGPPQSLTGWHAAPLLDAHLTASGSHLVYGCTSPVPGWYAAPLDGSGQGALVLPVSPPVVPGGGLGARPLQAGAHLIRRTGAVLEAFALDGSDAKQPIALALGVVAGPVTDPNSGRVVFALPADGGAKGAQIVAMRVGVPGLVPVMTLPGTVNLLTLLPFGAGALAVSGDASGSGLYAAHVDGSEAKAPRILATGLPGWLLSLASTATGQHLLVVMSVQATAVPHPDLLRAVAVQPGSTPPEQAAYAIAPAKFMPWSGQPWPAEPALGDAGSQTSTPDGKQVVLIGAGALHSVRVDGSDATAPTALGPAAEAVGPPLSPDGVHLVAGKNGELWVAQVGVAGSQRKLALPDGYKAARALWSDAGDRLVVLAFAKAVGSVGGQGRLFAIDATVPGAQAVALTGDGFAVDELAAVVPNAGIALVRSVAGADHSLYGVALGGSTVGSKPAPWTPVDDAGETLVGVLAAP